MQAKQSSNTNILEKLLKNSGYNLDTYQIELLQKYIEDFGYSINDFAELVAAKQINIKDIVEPFLQQNKLQHQYQDQDQELDLNMTQGVIRSKNPSNQINQNNMNASNIMFNDLEQSTIFAIESQKKYEFFEDMITKGKTKMNSNQMSLIVIYIEEVAKIITNRDKNDYFKTFDDLSNSLTAYLNQIANKVGIEKYKNNPGTLFAELDCGLNMDSVEEDKNPEILLRRYVGVAMMFFQDNNQIKNSFSKFAAILKEVQSGNKIQGQNIKQSQNDELEEMTQTFQNTQKRIKMQAKHQNKGREEEETINYAQKIKNGNKESLKQYQEKYNKFTNLTESDMNSFCAAYLLKQSLIIVQNVAKSAGVSI